MGRWDRESASIIMREGVFTAARPVAVIEGPDIFMRYPSDCNRTCALAILVKRTLGKRTGFEEGEGDGGVANGDVACPLEPNISLSEFDAQALSKAIDDKLADAVGANELKEAGRTRAEQHTCVL